jgi:hypothetical protein
MWQFTAGSPLLSSPAIAGDRVVVAADDGRVFCFG